MQSITKNQYSKRCTPVSTTHGKRLHGHRFAPYDRDQKHY